MFICLTGPLLPLFCAGKKKRGRGKGLPKTRELKQNSSLFQTSSTYRLPNFWQTPYFKTGGSPLSFSQVIKSHQSSCYAQVASPSPLTANLTPHAHLIGSAITRLSPSAHACQIIFVKHGLMYTTQSVSGSLFFLRQNLIYIFWRRILSLNKDI